MGLLRRLLTALDDALYVEVPEQRSPSPEEIITRHLTPVGQRLEAVGSFPHCACCTAYTPQPCPVIHRGPCNRAECQPEGAA